MHSNCMSSFFYLFIYDQAGL